MVLALLLPWAAGSLLWRAFPGQSGGPGSVAKTLGFGFFLGIVLVSVALWLLESLTGALSLWPVLALLTGLILAAGGWRVIHPRPAALMAPSGDLGSGKRLIGALLLFGILAHFAFSTLEVLAQPVFPWDGWTVWVYRAKAWFYAGHLAPIVSVPNWYAAADPQVYTTPGLNYPLLPSLVPLWAAMGLGAWHETLVNLPLLGCALAIGLGLAGCLRSSGVGMIGSLLAVYLLFSTPLFGVHMSLGGYADIWLAGFAGLGMTSLLCGLVMNRRPAVIVGFALLALGVGVKVEGFVWLFAGLLVCLLCTVPPKRIAQLAAAGLVLLLVAFLTGLNVIDLPGIGRVGLEPGRLFVPFKGVIALEFNDVGSAYWRSAFLLGSWHVLWALALVALALRVSRQPSPFRRTILAFFGVFAGLQVVIFVFTAQGAWAADFTAINRLPLQMLPAIIFMVVLAIDRALPRLLESVGREGTRGALLGGLAGGVFLTFATVSAWQWWEHRDAAAEERAVDPQALRFVIGGGRPDGDAVIIDRYQDSIALLSSGPVRLEAWQHTLLDVDLSFNDDIESKDQLPAFFWRTADDPRSVSRVTLMDSGLYDLADFEEWRGQIIEYGFFFVAREGEAPRLGSATLAGRSPGNMLRLIPRQWTAFEGWTQRSAHWMPGGAYEPVVPMTGLLIVMALLSAVLAWLLMGRREPALALVVMLLVAWGVLDLRWGFDRVRQAELSLAWLEHLSVAERLADGELGIHHDYLEDLRQRHFGPEPRKLLIVQDGDLHKYFGLRAKYQLLPHATTVDFSLPPVYQLRHVDYVLFLGDFADGDIDRVMSEGPGRRWKRLRLGADFQRAHRRALEFIEVSPSGTLFRVRERARAPLAPPAKGNVEDPVETPETASSPVAEHALSE